MANQKWRLFEYEYSVAEFVLCFIVVFLAAFFLMASLTTLSMHADLVWSLAVAIVLAAIWTYIRVSGLFKASPKRRR